MCPAIRGNPCTFSRSSRDILASEKSPPPPWTTGRIVIYEASTPEYFSHCPRSNDKSPPRWLWRGGGREPRFCNKVCVVSDLCAVSFYSPLPRAMAKLSFLPRGFFDDFIPVLELIRMNLIHGQRFNSWISRKFIVDHRTLGEKLSSKLNEFKIKCIKFSYICFFVILKCIWHLRWITNTLTFFKIYYISRNSWEKFVTKKMYIFKHCV